MTEEKTRGCKVGALKKRTIGVFLSITYMFRSYVGVSTGCMNKRGNIRDVKSKYDKSHQVSSG